MPGERVGSDRGMQRRYGSAIRRMASLPTMAMAGWWPSLRPPAPRGAPGPRPHFSPDYYSAYVRDPEGNKLHFVTRGI
jgi:hypothetical protein